MRTEELILLNKALHVLNMIPNKLNVGLNGESSYDVASEISKFFQDREKAQEPKFKTRFLFLDDCNGNEGKDPVAYLVDVIAPINDIEKLCEEIEKAEHTQAGIMRLGGSWKQALEMAEYKYLLIKSGKQSEFDDSEYSVEYRVVSGNY